MHRPNTIYVELLDDGTPCWRPVLAEQIADKVYRIVASVPDGERWSFQPGEVVRCEVRQFGDGDYLTARELVINT